MPRKVYHLEKSWWNTLGYLEATQRKQWKHGGEDLWIRQSNPMVSVGKWLQLGVFKPQRPSIRLLM